LMSPLLIMVLNYDRYLWSGIVGRVLANSFARR
jgi:hypothetical protein